ncbi:MAG: pyrroline-5-carboxylate reductase [Candidatus Omnitrophota bacterium]
MIKIGIIGGGNMGEAIIAGIHKAYTISLCEIDQKRAVALKRKYRVFLCDCRSIAKQCDTIILAVKPQVMTEALEEIIAGLRKDVLIVSIAAGITTSFLEKLLPAGTRVVRTMPNMPAQVGKGITALCAGRKAIKKDLKNVAAIFNYLGETIIVDEKMMDAVTAVSGSGPAYVFYFLECMVEAAQSLGFSKQQAIDLVRQTVSGSFHLLGASKESPLELRKKVTSKGGTTEAAMKVFETMKTRKIFKDAMMAARKRGRELAR